MKRLKIIVCILVLLLLSCSTQPRKAVEKQFHKPLINAEVNPHIIEAVSRLVYMRDPNIFKYREPSLDEKFGISRYKRRP